MKLTVSLLVSLFDKDSRFTRKQLETYFPLRSARDVARTINDARRYVKRLYIAYWEREAPGEKTHWRPVYALGDKPDAPKPPPMSRTEEVDRYRKKVLTKKLKPYPRTVAPATPNSVFDIAAAQRRVRLLEKAGL
jgi:hypothetical protein